MGGGGGGVQRARDGSRVLSDPIFFSRGSDRGRKGEMERERELYESLVSYPGVILLTH